MFVNDIAIFRNEPEKFSYVANVYQQFIHNSDLLKVTSKVQILLTTSGYVYIANNFEDLFGEPARLKTHPCFDFAIGLVGLYFGFRTIRAVFMKD